MKLFNIVTAITALTSLAYASDLSSTSLVAQKKPALVFTKRAVLPKGIRTNSAQQAELECTIYGPEENEQYPVLVKEKSESFVVGDAAIFWGLPLPEPYQDLTVYFNYTACGIAQDGSLDSPKDCIQGFFKKEGVFPMDTKETFFSLTSVGPESKIFLLGDYGLENKKYLRFLCSINFLSTKLQASPNK